MMRLSVRFTVFWVALALATAAMAQHEHGSGHEGHARSAWAELKETRDAIAKLIESGKLPEVHYQAERLAPLGDALMAGAKSVPDDKRVRIDATLRQLAELGKTLDKAGDAGDVAATSRELKRLDGVIALIQVQYPADLLSKVPAPGAMPAEHGSHVHRARPLASVDDAPKATIRVTASEFKFAPTALAMRAGEPTRIELENDGAVEHALIVAAPDGEGDWIHLHAAANSTDAGTFRIDKPGRYPVLCTVQGHTEAGMVGELVVQ
jgi:uncharacterized cupredoxin-like copper-binding protein